MKTYAIEGTLRSELGKKPTKAIRLNGEVPCVIYGGGTNIHFSTPTKSLRKFIYTPDFQVAEINVGGNVHRTILKDIQTHPVTDDIMHLDFQELIEDKKVIALIPIRVKGLSEGVKAGGKLTIKMRALKVKAYPKDLIDEIVLDVTDLLLGKSLRVKDIDVGGLEVMVSPNIPVASVDITRALRAARAEAAKE